MSMSVFPVTNAAAQGSAGGAAVVKLGPAWILVNYDLGVTSTCEVTFKTDGSIAVIRNGGGDTLPASDNWWTDNPSSLVGDDYEVAFTSWAAGSEWTSNQIINTWYALTSDVTFRNTVIGKNSPDTAAANNVTFSIRTVVGSVVQDTITGCYHSAEN